MKTYTSLKLQLFFFLLLASQLQGQHLFKWVKGSNTVNQSGVYGSLGTTTQTNNPGSREGAMTWKDTSNVLWLFGGYGYDKLGNQGHLNDLWKYNKSGNLWTWVSGDDIFLQAGVYGSQGFASATNKPGARAYAVTWQSGSDLYLFGGYGYDASGNYGFLNDLWKYSQTNNQWTWVHGNTSYYQPGVYGTMQFSSPNNLPGARHSASGWIDPTGNLWLFGGIGNTTSSLTVAALNDLWKYDLSINQWTWMGGSNTGNQPGTYGIKTFASSFNTPGSRQGAMTWVDLYGNFWLFGGTGLDSVGTTVTELNDLWRFEFGLDQWTWMSGSKVGNQPGIYANKGTPSPTITPGARHGGVTWLDNNSRLWLGFGAGYGSLATNAGNLNDLWFYEAMSNQWTWAYGGGGLDFSGIYGNIGVASFNNTPGGRKFSGAWADGTTNNLWLFGGFGKGISANASQLNDLWLFTNCANQISIYTASSPSVVCAGESATLMVFGSSSYTWSTGSTGTAIVVAPPSSSVYVVSTRDSSNNGCIFSDTIKHKVEPCLFVNSILNKGEQTIFPNPNNGTFVLESSMDGVLQIFNALGQAVLTETVREGANRVTSGLIPGVYLYRLNIKNGLLKTGRIVVGETQ